MLKQLAVSVFIFVIGFTSVSASAAFVPTNWKMDNDALATLDTATGLEWLDLTVTDGSTFGQVASALDSTLKGWRFPTEEEVFALMSSFFPSVDDPIEYHEQTVYTGEGTSQEPVNGPGFRTLFGFTYLYWAHGADWQGSTYGLFKAADGRILLSGYHRRNNRNGFYITYHNADTLATGDDYGYYQAGIFLVSDGGTTLSSQLDPTLNINNPDSPINKTGPVADVHVPVGFGMIFGVCVALITQRARRAPLNSKMTKEILYV